MKSRRNCGEALDSPPEPAPENERYYSDPLLSAVLGSAAHFFFFLLSLTLDAQWVRIRQT